VSRGLCGVGGRLSRAPDTLADAVVGTERTYGERAARRLERFAAVADGAQVWTRDERGHHHTGLLAGPWWYDDSPGAAAADLVHVRRCDWTEVPDDEVPDAVLATFARGGRNFQRITAL
jgi:hypothetical protein